MSSPPIAQNSISRSTMVSHQTVPEMQEGGYSRNRAMLKWHCDVYIQNPACFRCCTHLFLPRFSQLTLAAGIHPVDLAAGHVLFCETAVALAEFETDRHRGFMY
eukprot:2993351-Amphidinium_carterae.1